MHERREEPSPIKNEKKNDQIYGQSKTWNSRGAGERSAAAHLLRSWARIPPGVWICGRSPGEILGSNPTGGMDICLL